MEQLVEQLIQLLQQKGLGVTGGKPNAMGGLLPNSAPQNSAPQQSPLVTGASPIQKPPALQPNLGQQIKQNFNPQRLLSTPTPGGLQGLGI